jgi:superfamily II DNA or RNA helicase
MIQLRPYQVAAIKAVQQDWESGKLDVLGTAATGSGKTAIFLALLVEELAKHPQARALILSHRKELVEQPVDRLYSFWPEWKGKAGIVMAESKESYCQIVSATVQTLASERRLVELLNWGPIDYLITDECHHAVADSYGAVYDGLRSRNPHMRHLGVSATPIRADGMGLKAIYEHESFHYGIKEMVSQGWLVPPRWLAIQTGISVKGVKKSAGDFQAKQLADVFVTQNCLELVVETHKKYAADRQCIAFTPTVAKAYSLAKTFREAGISAEAADGTTDKDKRADLLERFRAGQVQVLCNVGLYTEGLDVPQVSCIHQVRPTESDGLYIQMIGRALRPVAGKQDALILDYCPKEVRNIVMLGDVLGVEAKKEAYIQDDEEEGAVIAGFTFDGGEDVNWLKGSAQELVSRQLDYLSVSPFSWHRAADGWLTVGLGQGSDKIDRTLAISAPGAGGKCELWGVAKRENERQAVGYRIQVGDFEELSQAADELMSHLSNATLAAKNRTWRTQQPTEAQERFARRLGAWEDGMSRGQCAEAITHRLALQAIARGEYKYAERDRATEPVRENVPALRSAA